MNPLKYITGMIILSVFILLSCEKNITNPAQESAIQIQVAFDTDSFGLDALGKIASITSVSVTVTGPEMDQVVQDLSFNSGTGTASGTVEVPKGSDRLFKVEGKDSRKIIQFSGSATKDINGDNESVSITVAWIVPDPVSLTINEIRSTSVVLSWNATNAPDFGFYRILISNQLPLNPSNDNVGDDITDRTNTTDWRITGLFPITKYYVAVVVVDTEGHCAVEADIQNFTTWTQVELVYDDGIPYDYRWWDYSNRRYSNRMSPPGTCRLLIARYYIASIANGGYFKSEVMDGSDNALASKDVAATSTGWIDVDYSNDNVIINEDFYIEMEYDGINKPGLGYDLDDNDRGWKYNGQTWEAFDGTYFIRAVVETEGSLVSLTSEPLNPKEKEPLRFETAIETANSLKLNSFSPEHNKLTKNQIIHDAQ